MFESLSDRLEGIFKKLKGRGLLKEDDVILSFAGKAVYDANDLSRFVSRTTPGSKVDVVVWREGVKKTIPVTVGKRKERSFAVRVPGGEHGFLAWAGQGSYGIQLSTLSEQLGDYFKIPGKKGVLVESVKEKSPAAAAGLQAGDVITRVGKTDVSRSVDVLRALGEYEEGEKVEVQVYRKGSLKTLTLEVKDEDGGGFNYFFEDFGGRGGAVVAPRMRMHFIPDPDIDVHIERFDDDAMDDLRRELRESLDGLKQQEIRIRKRAPMIEVRTKRITL